MKIETRLGVFLCSLLAACPGKVLEGQPDTSSGGSKPAKMETGAVVAVPFFISQGEKIRVDTRTGEYLGRA